MTTPTKEQRHEIYKFAKDIYENLNYIGLCSCIHLSHEEIFDEGIDYEYIPELYPEFGKFKPENLGEYDYWWPISDTYSRSKAINECIKQTE